MEPEDGFDKHMERRDEIIPVPEMAKLMRDDRLQLRRRQTIAESFGQ
jgi:hypothetical protein